MNDMFLFLTSASFVNDIATRRSNTDIIINTGKAPFIITSNPSTDPHCLFVFVSL